MSTALATAAPTVFGTDVLRHLDAQIASARRLLDAVLRQGAAIRNRDQLVRIALDRLIEESAGSVTVAVSTSKVRFEIGSVTLTSKLIDGTFPDYGRVIDTATATK